MKRINIYLLFIICMLQFSCTTVEDFKVLRETTGPYQTNCYLLFAIESKEAALIDPGWQIDTLVAIIKNNDLDLKYIFITHGHSDHYYYGPELKKQFPKVKWGLDKEDYEKIIKCPDWPLKAYGQEWVDRTRKNPKESIYLDFDTKSVGVPDIFVEGNLDKQTSDNETFIKSVRELYRLFPDSTVICPGHNRYT